MVPVDGSRDYLLTPRPAVCLLCCELTRFCLCGMIIGPCGRSFDLLRGWPYLRLAVSFVPSKPCSLKRTFSLFLVFKDGLDTGSGRACWMPRVAAEFCDFVSSLDGASKVPSGFPRITF